MTHLETLISEYLELQGFLVMKNRKVGPLKHVVGRWNLDIIGYRPTTNELVHYEPSIDAIGWTKREARYRKKFDAGNKYIVTELFPWLDPAPKLQQFAVFVDHPKNRHELAGGKIISIDEMMAEVRNAVIEWGKMSKRAVPEQYPLLPTIQLSHCGYYKLHK